MCVRACGAVAIKTSTTVLLVLLLLMFALLGRLSVEGVQGGNVWQGREGGWKCWRAQKRTHTRGLSHKQQS
jgi:uncharacterized protein (TIGR03382 family)